MDVVLKCNSLSIEACGSLIKDFITRINNVRDIPCGKDFEI